MKLDQTLGKGTKDRHDQPINLLRIPNSAVVEIYYTERTPNDYVEEVERRLGSVNNRYGTKRGIKLVLSEQEYGYRKSVV